MLFDILTEHLTLQQALFLIESNTFSVLPIILLFSLCNIDVRTAYAYYEKRDWRAGKEIFLFFVLGMKNLSDFFSFRSSIICSQ